MSLVTSMNIAQQALLVNQAALNVVSNNIANLNTEGYSRERVELAPGVNYTPLGGSVMSQVYSGSGVQIDSVQRYTDLYLQSYYRQQNSDNNYLKEYSQMATSVQSMTNELTGSKLEDAFASFFTAAQTLNSSPSDSTARQNYAQQAQSIALKLNNLADNLSEARTSLVGEVTAGNIATPGSIETSKIAGLIDQANNKLQQIASINSDIVKISSGNLKPNALVDTRDQLINELSAMIPVTVSDNSNGTVNISVNGLDLVKGTKLIGNLDVTPGTVNEPAVIQVVDSEDKTIVLSNNVNKFVTTGTIGAILDLVSNKSDRFTIKGVSDNLDVLANSFAKIINDIQTVADANGTPMAIDNSGATPQLTGVIATDNIFETSDGTATITAANIQVNQDILDDPFKIAAARVDLLTYDINSVGNNKNMQEVVSARTTNNLGLANSTPEGFLASMVGNIGLKVADLNSNLKNQTIVLAQVKTQLTSTTGVNLDEELIDLTKYQRAYQASARVYSVCNELLAALVNLGK